MNIFPLILYVGCILLVNILFSYVPMIDLGFGMFSPVAVIVGFTFVLRDYAQRAVHHFVLIGMAIGVVLSYVMANPFVATASAIAFASSELADYLLYTLTKKPFHQRVLWSSAISTPIDTIAFLYWIDAMTPGTVIIMIASKMIAALLIWSIERRRATPQFA